MKEITYSIAQEFSGKPGPRYVWQGTKSGEEFLKTVLLGLFDETVNAKQELKINLDGTVGYGPSFLEEAFGGLARNRNKPLIYKHLKFISKEEPFLIDEIMEYMAEAEQEQPLK